MAALFNFQYYLRKNNFNMKKYVLLVMAMIGSATLMAQPPDVPAVAGSSFGEKVTVNKPVTPQQLAIILKNKAGQKVNVQLKAEVTEVCTKEGCWIKVKGVDGNMMVKMKDHSFLVPVALNGKTIVLDGIAEIKVTSVDQLKHYAEDAGKSKEEIDAIKEPKQEVVINATGILVL
jgi:hypothetical protein